MENKTTDNQVSLVVAVFFATFLGVGTYLFRQDWKLSFFVAIIIFVLISKYETIKKFFHEKMTWLFNIK